MTVPWQVSFHVSGSSDFETRYAEVLAAHPAPVGSETDVAMAHDTAVAIIASHGIVVPMDVFLTGWLDAANVRANVTVTVNQGF